MKKGLGTLLLGAAMRSHAAPIDVGGALVELRQLIAIVDGLNTAPQLAPALRVLLDGRDLDDKPRVAEGP